ncbi:porin [Rhodosalinus sediminis]|nr:porin [Rhodosalinus sediminis]
MYRILLATTALVSFTGAAAAEITWSGEVALGYNDEELVEDGEGVIATAEIVPNLSVELDYGLTAEAEATILLLDQEGGSGVDTDDLSEDFEAESYILSLSNEFFGLSFGTVDFAPDSMWKSAGDMESDGFSEADGETGVLLTGSYGPVMAGVSSVLHTDDFSTGTGSGDFDQLGVAVNAELEGFDISLAYQEEAENDFDPANNNDDFEPNEILALSVGTTFEGLDVRLGYASDETADENSTGLELGYAIQDVSLGGYFVSESEGDDNWGVSAGYESGPIAVEAYVTDEQGAYLNGVEGSYAVTDRLIVRAGVIDDEDPADDGGSYIGGEYDLGNGASFLVSYADADNDGTPGEAGSAEDELGAPEYKHGLTALLTLEF